MTREKSTSPSIAAAPAAGADSLPSAAETPSPELASIRALPIRPMRHAERVEAALAHLAGMVPIWGGIVMGAILWRNRQRSRAVAFHAQQALFFHAAALGCCVAPLLLLATGRLAGVLRPALGANVQLSAKWLLALLFLGNALMVSRAANSVLDERPFDYPFFGKRLRRYFAESEKNPPSSAQS
jgi:hypothetical protein